MAKLQDMFSQAQRAQGGGGMGFLGKNRPDFKPRSTAIVVEFSSVTPGSAEAALKAGADGLLFSWDGKTDSTLEQIQKEIESAKTHNENVVSGLRLSGGWETLNRERLAQFKDDGIQYLILPFSAPAQLLALESKDVEKVVTVPMRSGELYTLFIRALSSLSGIAAVFLDFNFSKDLAALTIEDVLQYQAIREAVRYPAFLPVSGEVEEADIQTLKLLGVQAFTLPAQSSVDATTQQIKSLRELLEKQHQEDKEAQATHLR